MYMKNGSLAMTKMEEHCSAVRKDGGGGGGAGGGAAASRQQLGDRSMESPGLCVCCAAVCVRFFFGVVVGV
jgi:hypothetical protein